MLMKSLFEHSSYPWLKNNGKGLTVIVFFGLWATAGILASAAFAWLPDYQHWAVHATQFLMAFVLAAGSFFAAKDAVHSKEPMTGFAFAGLMAFLAILLLVCSGGEESFLEMVKGFPLKVFVFYLYFGRCVLLVTAGHLLGKTVSLVATLYPSLKDKVWLESSLLLMKTFILFYCGYLGIMAAKAGSALTGLILFPLMVIYGLKILQDEI